MAGVVFGVGPLAVARVVDGPLVRGALPEDVPGAGVERDHNECVLPIARFAVRVYEGFAAERVTDRRRAGNARSLEGGRQEEMAVPDDRR